MKTLRLILMLFILPVCALAQGAQYTGVAQTARNMIGMGNVYVPIPGASVNVCTGVYTGTACPSGGNVTVYSNQALTTSLTQPLTADNYGNFTFWAAPGAYYFTVTGQGAASSSYQITLPFGISGAYNATSKSIEQVRNADQYCATPGALDQSCINNAENDAVTNGATVYIPIGTYTINAQVTIKAPTYAAPGAILKEANGLSLAAPFVLSGSGILVRDVTFDCNAANNTGSSQTTGCVSGTSLTNVTLQHVTVQNWYGATGSSAPCINLNGAGSGITVEDSTVSSCGASGHAGDGIYASGSHIHLIGNTISAASDTGAVCEAFTDCVIAHNHFINDTQAYAFSGLVTGTPSNGGVGVGNVIDGGGPAANGGMVEALNIAPGSLSNITFTGDTIRSAVSTRGIFIERSSKVAVSNETVTGLSGTALQAILVQESRDVDITGGITAENVDGVDIAGCTDCTLNGAQVLNNTSNYGIALGPSPNSISVSALTHSGGVCTATIPASVPFAAGDYITVSGATGDTACNGTYPIASVPSSTSITYAVAGSGTPAGTISLVMEMLRGGVKSAYVHGASQTDGIALYGNPQQVAITDDDLLGNGTAFADATTGGSYTYQGNVETTAGVSKVKGSLVFLSASPAEFANNTFLTWLNSGGTSCNVVGATNDTNSITRFFPCTDAGGFQWVNQAASAAWLSLSASGLTLSTGGNVPSGQTFNGAGTFDFSGGALKQPASYTVGANSINNPSSAGTLAITAQLPLFGSVAGSTTSLAANTCGDVVTQTVTGAATTMTPVVTVDGALPTSGLVIQAAVTSANTVSIEYCNVTTGSVVPAAATLEIRVIQ